MESGGDMSQDMQEIYRILNHNRTDNWCESVVPYVTPFRFRNYALH